MNKFLKTELPDGWKKGRINELIGNKTELIVGGPFGSNRKVSNYRSKGIPAIRVQNVQAFHFSYKNMRYLLEKKAEELKYHSFIGGDIVLAKLGDPVGKTCLIPKDLKYGIVMADVIRIRNLNPAIDTKFLIYMLNSRFVYNQLMMEIKGSTRPRTNLKDVRNLIILVPPLNEQQKIAAILSNIDVIIQQTQQLIDQLQLIKKGLMQQLFMHGVGHAEFKDTRIDKIPKEWEIKTLKEVAGSGTYGLNASAIGYSAEQPRYVRITDISDEGFLIDDEIKSIPLKGNEKYLLKKNDLVFARTGSVGKSYLHPETKDLHIYAGYLIKFSPKTSIISPKYLFYFTKCPKFFRWVERVKRTGVQPNINSKEYESLKIPIPPLEEQKNISMILKNFDNKIRIERTYIKQLKLVKKGLMQQLLTGKKRVPIN